MLLYNEFQKMKSKCKIKRKGEKLQKKWCKNAHQLV